MLFFNNTSIPNKKTGKKRNVKEKMEESKRFAEIYVKGLTSTLILIQSLNTQKWKLLLIKDTKMLLLLC